MRYPKNQFFEKISRILSFKPCFSLELRKDGVGSKLLGFNPSNRKVKKLKV